MEGQTRIMQEKIGELLACAEMESRRLTPERQAPFGEAFMRARELLQTPVKGADQGLLILSASLQQMRKTERLVIDAMRLDAIITFHEEALLVRLRLICSQVIHLLTNTSEELRLSFA